MIMRWRPITHRNRTPLDDRNRPCPSPVMPVVSREEIARLAYSYWEARGRPHGSAAEDWLRAERELREVTNVAGATSTETSRPATEVVPRSKEYAPQAS